MKDLYAELCLLYSQKRGGYVGELPFTANCVQRENVSSGVTEQKSESTLRTET